MRILFAILLTVFSGLTVFGTEQYPDTIIYNGKKYRLFTNPLESYFEKYPDKRPKFKITSSALWRGYVATFEIIDNQIYLKDIEILVRDTTDDLIYKTKSVSVLNEVLPNQELIKIDWRMGLLLLPYEKMDNYVHHGYDSTYSYVLLEIDKRLSRNRRYRRNIERRFKVFMKTDEYKKNKVDLQKDSWSDEDIDTYLRHIVIGYNVAGKILIE